MRQAVQRLELHWKSGHELPISLAVLLEHFFAQRMSQVRTRSVPTVILSLSS